MGKVIVVTSGKGGVGKTTSTAALGAALARAKHNVVVVDFDVGLRNLDLVMGAERRVVFDLINVVQGTAKLPQALIRDKRIESLYLLPASQTRDKDALTEDGVGRVIAELRMRFDSSTRIGCWDDSLSKLGAVEIATTGQWNGQTFGLKGGLGSNFNHAKIGVSTSGGV